MHLFLTRLDDKDTMGESARHLTINAEKRLRENCPMVCGTGMIQKLQRNHEINET
jgi:hypothetical protein